MPRAKPPRAGPAVQQLTAALKKATPYIPLATLAAIALALTLWALGQVGLWLTLSLIALYLLHPHLAGLALALATTLDHKRGQTPTT